MLKTLKNPLFLLFFKASRVCLLPRQNTRYYSAL